MVSREQRKSFDVNSLWLGFRNFRLATGKAKTTIEKNKYWINRFLVDYEDSFIELDEKTLRLNFQEFMAGATSATNHNFRLKALRPFAKWLVAEDFLQKDFTDNIGYRREEGRFSRVPPEDIINILDVINTRTYTGYRDYCLILFCADTGIRPLEALQLEEFRFDLDGLQVEIPKKFAKTRNSRTLPISPQVATCLQKLIVKFREPTWDGNVPMFASWDGKRMEVGSWSHKMRKYSKKAGVKVTPYDLRHFFATRYLLNGGDPFRLQKMMGHSKVDMTQRYVNLVSADLKSCHKKVSPINNILPTSKRVKRGRR